jgi:hypothetical protein
MYLFLIWNQYNTLIACHPPHHNHGASPGFNTQYQKGAGESAMRGLYF